MENFFPCGYGIGLTEKKGNWKESDILGIYPPLPCSQTSDPTVFLQKLVLDSLSFRDFARVECTEVSLPDKSSENLLVIIVWLEFSKLKRIHNAKQKEFIASVCSWVSDEWFLLEDTSLEALALLCKPNISHSEKIHVESNNSFLSILEDVAKPILSRPWDRLKANTSHVHGNNNSGGESCLDLRIFDFPPLPSDMLREICLFLDAPSLFRFACCNSYLRDCTLGIIPGLALRLHPHQFTTVWWMLQQEHHFSRNLRNYEGRERELLDHPVIFERTLFPGSREVLLSLERLVALPGCFTSFISGGAECDTYHADDYNTLCGFKYDFRQKCVSVVQRMDEGKRKSGGPLTMKGGMLCDEPGLGKTISMLSVILKTLGSISTPSPGKNDNCSNNNGNNCDHTTSTSSIDSTRLKRRRSVSSGVFYNRETGNSKGLLASGTSLIIIPDVLMDHWKLQINSYINPKVLKKVYFDDKLQAPLPSAEILASCDVVITTFKRLSSEWRHGKPLCGSEMRPRNTFVDEFQGGSTNLEFSWCGNRRDDPHATRSLSPLLEVHWLRVVVDEGHALGKSGVSNIMQLACTLTCDRRWILTGTPTPSVSDEVTSALLRHIGNILKFLRHEPFGRDDGRELWKQLVSRPMEASLVSSSSSSSSSSCPMTSSLTSSQKQKMKQQTQQPRKLLIQVLSQIMIRHCKESIREIPKPIWKVTKLKMNQQEKASYNAVVALAKSNLVVTGKDYVNPGSKHQDSLLNPKNRKFLFQTLANIRVASCGGGHTKLTLIPFESRRAACLQLLRESNLRGYASSTCVHTEGYGDEHTSDEELEAQAQSRELEQNETKISTFISAVTQGVLWSCECCRIRLPLLLITPCYHLFCPDCMNDMGDCCRLCQHAFSWDTFQQLQPGFEASDYLFHINTGGGEIPPPLTDVAFLPTATAATSAVSPQLSSSVSFALPPSPLPLLPSSTPAHGHTNDLIHAQASEDEEHRQEEHGVKEGGEGEERNQSELPAPSYLSTKAQYLLTRIKELDSQYLTNMELFFSSRSHLLQKKTIPPKIIVFSQFSEFLDKLTLDFEEMKIKYVYFKGVDKARAIHKFKTISDIRVLFLTKEGSHGLDLSCVTHIFLMDSILDESVLLQVISRAFRMGSKQSVVIDQVMMKDTIEETIFMNRKMNKSTLQSRMELKMNEYNSGSNKVGGSGRSDMSRNNCSCSSISCSKSNSSSDRSSIGSNCESTNIAVSHSYSSSPASSGSGNNDGCLASPKKGEGFKVARTGAGSVAAANKAVSTPTVFSMQHFLITSLSLLRD